MPHYPFTRMIPCRWPFYTFTLLCALFQAFNALNAPPYDSTYLPPFATACAILAIVTFLWICMLLGYSHCEIECQHTLTRCYAHIISFGAIALLWFGLGVILAIHAEIECHRHSHVCKCLWFSTLLAFLVFLFSCLSVAAVICPIAVAGVGFNTHVEDARERAKNSPRNRQQPETGEASIDLVIPRMPSLSLPRLPLRVATRRGTASV